MSETVVSEKTVRKNFRLTGIALLAYVLAVLYAPHLLLLYLKQTAADLYENEILFFGIFYLFLMAGSLIPFFLMRRRAKLPLKKIFRNIDASILDLVSWTIIFFSIVTFLTFVSDMVVSRLGIAGTLLSNIGCVLRSDYLSHPMFVFIYVIASPILEEYVFRGVLLQVLGKYGKNFALLATSALFALCHSYFSDVIPALAMGVLLGRVAIRYKSIQPTIIIHILFDLFIYVLCVLPSSASQYIQYILMAVYLVAVLLLIFRKSLSFRVPRGKNGKMSAALFFGSPTVILAILLMIGHFFLFLNYPY